MSHNRSYRVLAAIVVLAFAAATPLHAQTAPAAPDAGLYTAYSLFPGNGGTIISWVVCGSTGNSDGCYGAGQLGPFVVPGAILEGAPTVKSNVVTRSIYVVDSGSVSDVKLYVYKKVDTLTAGGDTITVTLKHTITLPLTGGSAASCSMAANKRFLFIGTDQGELAAMVQKSNLAITQVGSVPGNIVAITADPYGYVTINNAGSGFTDFTVFKPNGQSDGDGGGFEFVVGTTQAVPLTALASANARLAPRMSHKARVATHADVK
jgi:hypothetical protein